jgi:hypothetical protein
MKLARLGTDGPASGQVLVVDDDNGQRMVIPPGTGNPEPETLHPTPGNLEILNP